MKVRVLEPDLKLLLNSGAFVRPKVGDVIDIANAQAEINIGIVEAVRPEAKLSEVKEEKPTKGLDYTNIDEPEIELDEEVEPEVEEPQAEQEDVAEKAPKGRTVTVKKK